MSVPSATPRRRERSPKITLAVALLGVSTAVVATAAVTRLTAFAVAAAVVAAAAGWVALRLAWAEVRAGRLEHATDRAALARTYRRLFDENAAVHRRFVSETTARLSHRERRIVDLEDGLASVELRAGRAERRNATLLRRQEAATARTRELEATVRAQSVALEAAEAALEQPVAAGARVSEWSDLETDPTAALLAWEERTQEAAPIPLDQAQQA